MCTVSQYNNCDSYDLSVFLSYMPLISSRDNSECKQKPMMKKVQRKKTE